MLDAARHKETVIKALKAYKKRVRKFDFTNDLVREHHLRNCYPVQRKGQWQCKQCHARLLTTHVGFHVCKKAPVQNTPNIVQAGACILCGRKAAVDAKHDCNAQDMRTYGYDLSDTMELEEQRSKEDDIGEVLRYVTLTVLRVFFGAIVA